MKKPKKILEKEKDVTDDYEDYPLKWYDEKYSDGGPALPLDVPLTSPDLSDFGDSNTLGIGSPPKQPDIVPLPPKYNKFKEYQTTEKKDSDYNKNHKNDK